MKKMVIALVIIFLIINIKFSQAQADREGIIQVNIIPQGDCILNFVNGWNLFSFCSELQDTNLLDVFSSLDGKYRYIMRWNTTKQEFDIYSPRATENSFTTFDDNESYFVYMYGNAGLGTSGNEAGPETRTLVKGWTGPSYPYRFTTLIETMVSTIRTDLRYIMKWNQSSQEFDIYSFKSANNPFYEINLGDGQMIYAWNSTSLEYSGT